MCTASYIEWNEGQTSEKKDNNCTWVNFTHISTPSLTSTTGHVTRCTSQLQTTVPLGINFPIIPEYSRILQSPEYSKMFPNIHIGKLFSSGTVDVMWTSSALQGLECNVHETDHLKKNVVTFNRNKEEFLYIQTDWQLQGSRAELLGDWDPGRCAGELWWSWSCRCGWECYTSRRRSGGGGGRFGGVGFHKLSDYGCTRVMDLALLGGRRFTGVGREIRRHRRLRGAFGGGRGRHCLADRCCCGRYRDDDRKNKTGRTARAKKKALLNNTCSLT